MNNIALISKNQVDKVTPKKRKSHEIALFYDKLGEKDKAESLRNCGTFLKYALIGDKMRMIEANFCKVRMCPMCAWRRSQKNAFDLKTILTQPEFVNQDYVFFTLTVKNVKADKLKDTIDMMSKAFGKMSSNKNTFFRKCFTGWVRNLEVTYNPKEDTFHPHFHVLCSVNKSSYFKKDNKYYMSHNKLMELWQAVMNLDYEPSVQIEKIKPNKAKGTESLLSAVLEVSKYSTKFADIKNEYILQVLDESLYGRRLIAYGGLIKEVRKRLKIKDPDSTDLTDVEEVNVEQVRKDRTIPKIIFKWDFSMHKYIVELEKPPISTGIVQELNE